MALMNTIESIPATRTTLHFNTPEKNAAHGRAVKMLLFSLLAGALVAWATPPVALVAGMIFAVCIGNPLQKSGHHFAKGLLQICVVMLGFGMNLPVILRAGWNGSLFAALTIGTTLALGYWIGGRLKINRNTSILISAGTAICGGSAIAAVGSVLAVTEGEIAVAMGTVFLLNAAALYLFPVMGHALHLSQHQFGTWAGVAIHDISSVVGAALAYGNDALETATAVKLSRTLWIVPLTLGLALWLHGAETTAGGRGGGRRCFTNAHTTGEGGDPVVHRLLPARIGGPQLHPGRGCVVTGDRACGEGRADAGALPHRGEPHAGGVAHGGVEGGSAGDAALGVHQRGIAAVYCLCAGALTAVLPAQGWHLAWVCYIDAAIIPNIIHPL